MQKAHKHKEEQPLAVIVMFLVLWLMVAASFVTAVYAAVAGSWLVALASVVMGFYIYTRALR